jgi:hypothetical protein
LAHSDRFLYCPKLAVGGAPEFGNTIWILLPPPLSTTPSLGIYLKDPKAPLRPHLTVGLEAIYHHLPLGLVLPEVPEELFFRIVLADPL